MDLLHTLIDVFVHLDTHLGVIIDQYGTMTYVLLFLIIFCETGLVITPFLPGDSLLFAAGTFAAKGNLQVGILFFLFAFAGFLGDTTNYWIGSYVGRKVYRSNAWFLNHKHLENAHEFYEKNGARTIIFARFIPIMRTFAPFVAGVSRMEYTTFLMYNLMGSFIWVSLFLFGGFFFGTIPWVEQNFSLVILAIICATILPTLWRWMKHVTRKKS
ncbi:MAG: VTT domain-containing protein [Candidatus Peribacteraceae bacterium]|nr:VTT domain-containing protein [Candidatus Peribacteraceae bacterium]